MQLMPDVPACLAVCGTATFGMTVGCKARLVVTPGQAELCCALHTWHWQPMSHHVTRFTCDSQGSNAYYRHVPLVMPPVAVAVFYSLLRRLQVAG